jgi:hypothetical protein
MDQGWNAYLSEVMGVIDLSWFNGEHWTNLTGTFGWYNEQME